MIDSRISVTDSRMVRMVFETLYNDIPLAQIAL